MVLEELIGFRMWKLGEDVEKMYRIYSGIIRPGVSCDP